MLDADANLVKVVISWGRRQRVILHKVPNAVFKAKAGLQTTFPGFRKSSKKLPTIVLKVIGLWCAPFKPKTATN
jgi:hypothetical protein